MIEYAILQDYLHQHLDALNNIMMQHLALLQQLAPTPDVSSDTYYSHIRDIHQMGHILIAVEGNRIVGTGTLLVEPKLIHGGRYAGHIEDLAVDPAYRGQGIGSTIVNRLKESAKMHNCYKIILNCKEELISFYEKAGFEKGEAQMKQYL